MLRADCLAEPREVFAFLKVSWPPCLSSCFIVLQNSHKKSPSEQEHNIGQNFALYYIAYAAYLELRGSYAKALEMYNAGLDK